MIVDWVRARVAERLERNGPSLPFTQVASSVYAAFARAAVRRPLVLPREARVIGIGGSTLGGSGKTPLAMAVALALAERGERVALVGHAYRARPGAARVVGVSDDVREVGDEALLAARRLFRSGVFVVVAPERQSALDFAAQKASLIVVDGLLQTRPEPLFASLLAVDGFAAWGNRRLPPAGDLRAPIADLLAAADAVAVLRDELEPPESPSFSHGHSFDVVARMRRARVPDGSFVALGELCSARVGLITTLARPERVHRALSRRGIQPTARVRYADHATLRLAALDGVATRNPPVDVWLTTEKCATKLPGSIGLAPLYVLDYELELPKSLIPW